MSPVWTIRYRSLTVAARNEKDGGAKILLSVGLAISRNGAKDRQLLEGATVYWHCKPVTEG